MELEDFAEVGLEDGAGQVRRFWEDEVVCGDFRTGMWCFLSDDDGDMFEDTVASLQDKVGSLYL